MTLISSADRVLDVLLAVGQGAGPKSARTLAAECEIPVSTVYRLLETLEQRGLVRRLGHDQGFVTGPACLTLGQDRSSAFLLSLVTPSLRALARRTQESVGLMVVVGAEVLCLEMFDSPLPLRCSYQKGAVRPLRRGASAKALLAHLPAAVQRAVLDAQMVPAHERAGLLEELAAVRERGYATSASEVDDGVWGVSAPLLSGSRLEAAVSLMAPVTRARQRQDELIGEVLRSAQAITQTLSSLRQEAEMSAP